MSQLLAQQMLTLLATGTLNLLLRPHVQRHGYYSKYTRHSNLNCRITRQYNCSAAPLPWRSKRSHGADAGPHVLLLCAGKQPVAVDNLIMSKIFAGIDLLAEPSRCKALHWRRSQGKKRLSTGAGPAERLPGNQYW